MKEKTAGMLSDPMNDKMVLLKNLRCRLKRLQRVERRLTDYVKYKTKGFNRLVNPDGEIIATQYECDFLVFDKKQFREDHPDLYLEYCYRRPQSFLTIK